MAPSTHRIVPERPQLFLEAVLHRLVTRHAVIRRLSSASSSSSAAVASSARGSVVVAALVVPPAEVLSVRVVVCKLPKFSPAIVMRP